MLKLESASARSVQHLDVASTRVRNRTPDAANEHRKTVAAALDAFLALQNPVAGGGGQAVACFERWRLRWGQLPVASWHRQDVRQYLTERARRSPAAVVECERRALEAFVRWLSRLDRRAAAPGAIGALDELDTGVQVAWTPEEQKRLLWACRELTASSGGPVERRPLWLFPMTLLGLHTGLRIESLIDLSWSDIDPITRRIHVRAGERRLDIAMTGATARALEAIWRAARKRRARPVHVFDGLHLPRTYSGVDLPALRTLFDKAQRIAGIRRGSFSSLRCSCARDQRRSGRSFKRIACGLDWSDLAYIVSLYHTVSPRDHVARPATGARRGKALKAPGPLPMIHGRFTDRTRACSSIG